MRWIAITIALAGIGIAILLRTLIVSYFPFRRDTLLKQLEQQTGDRAEIAQFTERWIDPGFTARKIHIADSDGDVITADAMTVRSSYLGLLRTPKILDRIDISGLRISIAAGRPASAGKPFGLSRATGSPPGIKVREIHFDNAALDLPRSEDAQTPLEFAFRMLTIRNPDNGGIAFEGDAHNPIPPGEVHLQGKTGPLDLRHPERIPIEGKFTFEKADLTAPNSISGLLNASGNCRGALGQLTCAGTADVPRFQVAGSSHSVHIASRYNTTVDALTGDTRLNEVVARFNNTTVSATGTVETAGKPKGTTLTLDLTVSNGRIEDVLLLFTSAPKPGMRGIVNMKGRFIIPPGPPDFLTKLRVNGAFSIAHAVFSNPNSQERIDRLSASAAGEPKKEQRDDPELATGDIQASVTARNGAADLEKVLFSFPGIAGNLAGTYTLHQKQIHMEGAFQTTGKLADTTSGVKSFILKALGPMFPKQGSVKSIPFAISGSSSQPSFRLRLHDK